MRCNNETTLWLFLPMWRKCSGFAKSVLFSKTTICAKYLYQSNTLRTFRNLGNFVSFNDELKLLYNALSKNFPFTPYMIYFKAVTYPFFTLFYIRSPPPCTAHFCFSYYFLFSGQIHSPWLGDIVDSDIWLSYRPASLCSLVVNRYDNQMPELTLSAQSGTINLATAHKATSLVYSPRRDPLAYLKPKENGTGGREQWGGWSA
jgi:hypothetical protein